jgi:chitodextrinase
MWRAALPCRRVSIALLASILATATAVAASPAKSSTAAPSGQVWAVALPGSVTTVKQGQLDWLAARGVTTVVAIGAPEASLQRLAAAAKRARLTVLAPRAKAPRVACRSTSGTLRTCAALAPTAVVAVKLARRSLVDYVVVRVHSPQQLRMLRGSHAKRSRIVAILPLNQKAAGRAAWRAGIAYAAADPVLDLGVASAPGATTRLGSYLSQLPRTRTAAAAGPAAPTSLLVTARSTSTVTLRWTAPVGGAAGYGVYADGDFELNVSAVSITLTGLQCGRSYTLGVDAYDDNGVRSGRISTSTSTNACANGGGGGGSGGGGGGSTDLLPPTAPLGLVKGTSTQSSIVVSWTPASDNVGVTGYGLYRNGIATGSSIVPSSTFSGLACGTTYTLAVEAYDAAGNRSGRTSLSAATSACAEGADTTAPSAPGALTRTGSTMTSISVSWGAATDNVGVAGYGLYRNSSSSGTSATTSATLGGLVCGSSYTLAVDAYDAAGNRSGRTSLTTATSACPPSTDTEAPSVPQGMAFGTVTGTTVVLVWNASTDNVGVAGYRLLRNDVSVATVATPGYTYVGLTCGTSYTFALEAYDAAGNVSSRTLATGTISTSACAGSPPPPPPPPPPSPPPAGNAAHLWVDTNGGSCTRSASAGAYSDAAACAGLNAAYQAAANGDTILVRGGSYGGQIITEKTAAAAPGIRIASTTGETVTYARVEIKGSFIQLTGPFVTNGLELDGSGNSAANRPVEEVLIEYFEVDGQGLDGSPIGYLRGVDRVTWRNGTVHHNKNMSLVLADQEAAAGGVNNVTFDRMVFHDALLDASSSAHTECLYAQGIGNLRITNSHFYRCAVMDVFVTRWTGTDVDAVGGYIENNVFEAPLSAGNVCCAGNAFHFRDGGEPAPDIDNWDVRYNVFASALSFGSNENVVEGGGLRVVGNVFLGSSACKSGATYAYNVHGDGSSCGGTGEVNSNSTTIRSGFAGYVGSIATNNNWRLSATSVLIDKGNPGSYPGGDRDGNTRYTGNGPDAGPFEYQ